VIIDENFVWDQSEHGAEVTLPGATETIKIGYNNSDNARSFNFSTEVRPVLCVEPGQPTADLENIPAIRRQH
jgi:hypothetical protein